MDDLAARRGMFRLGVLTTALAVLVLSLGVTAPVGGTPPWWWWLTLGALGATGIGLLVGARFARVLGGLLLLACGG
jgi:ABC-type multidrug transport system permease subunit